MFCYFLPTSDPSPSPALQAILPYAWRVNDVHGRQAFRSPLGEGLIMSRRAIPLESLVFGAAEEWRKIPGKEAWIKQVGPATPGMLQRAPTEFIDGYHTELGDGQVWVVPRALRYDTAEKASSALPQRDALRDDGTWGPGEMLPKYQRLWAAAKKISEADGSWKYEDEIEASIAALQLHYYVDAIECDMMGLFSPQHRDAIWRAIMDTYGYASIKKKLESDGLSLGLGS